MTIETPRANPDFRLPDGRALFMSYGLLNRLSLVVGKLEDLPLIYLDANLQAAVISNVLGSYDTDKKEFTAVDPDQVNYPPLVIADLLAWISEHLLDFFAQTLQKTKHLEEKFKALSQGLSLPPSSDGSKA